MPSLIRRILGKRDDNRPPPGWAGWEGPWHVWCTGPRVARVHDQQFACDDPRAERERDLYVLRGLTAWHVLDGEDHILVSHALANVLARSCPDTVELVPADVVDAPTGKHLNGYSELRPREHITRDDILSLKPKDARVWRYEAGGSHLFVSKAVKLTIEQERTLSLQFWPGLSSFFD
jgi:hypothetical protein